MSPRQTSRSALSDEVADHVRGLVMTGQVREGDYIRLDALAEELDMSVTPVREGLLTLQGEGFVELMPRRGFVVRALAPKDVEDVFWVQAQIEGEITRRAAPHFADNGVTGLRAIQDALEVAARRGDREQVERLNYDFHHAIARVVDSSRLRWFLKQAAQMSPNRFFPQVEGWTQAAVDDHGAIIDALAAGDAETAATAMLEHVTHAGRLLMAKVTDSDDSPATSV
jgi:DNA-binding GntR family transcriptional regulator